MSINKKMTGNYDTLFLSEGNERQTPDWLFKRLDEEFNFTLDPCASPNNAKCKKFFTINEDGLKQDWSKDVVFVNPPYGNVLKIWVQKVYREFLKGATVVLLVPMRTNHKWWHEYCMKATEIRLIDERIKFLNSHGESYKFGAPFPLALVIFKYGIKVDFPKFSVFHVKPKSPQVESLLTLL